MKSNLLLPLIVMTLPCFSIASAVATEGVLIFEDSFDRTDSDPAIEAPGNGWQTNSHKRAKGEKQVALRDGAMYIYRSAVADHGVSVVQDLAFKDATVMLRFKLGQKDILGVNFADMKEKSVWAGHICLVQVRTGTVEITDLKTGRMNLEIKQRKTSGKATDADKKLVKSKSKIKKQQTAVDQWHDLKIDLIGDTIAVAIDGQEVSRFSSSGIAHETKSRIRLAVPKNVWVDNIKVYRR